MEIFLGMTHRKQKNRTKQKENVNMQYNEHNKIDNNQRTSNKNTNNVNNINNTKGKKKFVNFYGQDNKISLLKGNSSIWIIYNIFTKLIHLM